MSDDLNDEQNIEVTSQTELVIEEQELDLALRPDPVFKEIVRIDATENGMILLESQLPQLLTADFLLYAPPNVSLVGTKFDFFRTYTMIDFKSENDDFDEREYTKNEVRVAALFLQKTELKMVDILNLFICSRKPDKFFKAMHEQGQKFKRVVGRKWLWECQVGRQKVMVVVCRDLPFDEKYYRWLAFAPTTNPNWQKLIATLVTSGADWELLKLLEQMRPQEVIEIMKKTIEQLGAEKKFTPELAAKLRENDLYYQEQLMLGLSKTLKPEDFAMLVDPKVVLSKLSAEEIAAALSQEERKKLLKLLSQEGNTNKNSDQ